jgi:hypothetical protein
MSRDGNVIKKCIVYFTGADITFKDTALIQLSTSVYSLPTSGTV